MKSMKPLISLIIPVYKAEDFIEACLQSVFKQIPDGVEVILVDDGTPDKSMSVVTAEFDQRIKNGQLILLKQSNMGPGAARNTGVRQSRGDYIAFLDSDDVLLDGYFDEVVEHLKNANADVIEFGFKRFSDDANISSVIYSPLYNLSGPHKLTSVRERVFSVGCWYPSTRIYRKSVIQDHPFPEGTHYEDLMTIPFIYLQDLTVFFIDKPLLGYRYNPHSITSTHTAKQLDEKYAFYKSIPLNTDCDPKKILKLKTARGMIYFYSELSTPGFPIDELIDEIKAMRLSPNARKQLRLADRLFFYFPASYVRMDKVRVPAKKLLAKIRHKPSSRITEVR